MKITQEQVDLILEIMFDTYGMNVDDDTFRSDYSGRGMYGKTCVGFVVESNDQVAALGGAITRAFIHVNHESEIGTDVRMLANVRHDSMGRDVIVYFPGVTLDE